MFRENFTPSFQIPKLEKEKPKQKPQININPGSDNLSFDKMPTLGANLDLSHSFEFCAMNIKGFQNSFYNQWEADLDDIEDRKILEDLRGSMKLGNLADNKEELSLFSKERRKDRNFTGQNELFQSGQQEAAEYLQDGEGGRGLQRGIAVQEVEHHAALRKRDPSQKRNLKVITRETPNDSPTLGRVDKMIPNRVRSPGETVESEFIQCPLPDKDSGSKISKSSFVKDDKSPPDTEPKEKIHEEKKNEIKHQASNRQVLINEPVMEDTEEDMTNSNLRNFQKRRKEWLNKQTNIRFNVMVVGASGLGKSTFIDAFLKKKYIVNNIIRSTTEEIEKREGFQDYDNLKFKITLIDTPGYSDKEPLDKWYAKIETYITNQFYLYKQEKAKTYPKNSNEVQIEDSRVHAVLYFLTGPRVSQVDIENMLKLQEYCNLIPVLAKGDCYTIEEVKEIKKQILQETLQYKIEFFNFFEALKDSPKKLQELKNGKFGQSPPFLIFSSAKQIEVAPNRYVYGREYPWGTCYIENPQHSDFILLQSLLGGYICLEATQLTHYNYKLFMRKIKQQKKQQKAAKNKQVGVGFLVACGLAYLTLKKTVFR